MSKISLSPDASGTGIFTIASPNSNTNRTLTLPDDTGTIVTNSGNQAGSFTTLNTSGAVVFNDAGADVDFRVEGDTDANLLFVDAGNDRIGIGTSSPTTKLNIAGANVADIQYRSTRQEVPPSASRTFYSAVGGAYSTGTTEVDSAFISFATDGAWSSTSAPSRITFGTTPSGSTTFAERLRIDSSGNVGIGTSSPAATSNYTVAQINGTNGGFLKFSYGGTLGGSVYGNAGGLSFNGNGSTQSIYFWTGAAGSEAERMRINSSGNLLVGTTSELLTSANRMEVVGTNGIGIKSTGSAGNSPLLAWNSASSGDNYFVVFYTEASITQRGSIDYNRTGGLVRYNTISDATLKNIIGDSDGQKSLEILNSTRIREFAWKDDETQKPQIGVIAQELYETYKGAVSVGGNYEEIVPAVTEQRLVSEAVLDEDGNEIEAAVYETVEVEPERTETKYRPWGVDKTAFTFHLVAGWQAHEKIIKQQADMIAALEARIAALETGA